MSVGSHSSAPGVAIWEGGEDASGGVASTGTPTGIWIRETDMGGGGGREGEVLQLNMADDVHTYRLYSGKVLVKRLKVCSFCDLAEFAKCFTL